MDVLKSRAQSPHQKLLLVRAAERACKRAASCEHDATCSCSSMRDDGVACLSSRNTSSAHVASRRPTPGSGIPLQIEW